jgi:hypothetical protein
MSKPRNMTFELLNEGMDVKPNLSYHKALYPTHRNFRAFQDSKGWGVKAIRRDDWEKIAKNMEAEFNMLR